jgi:hypothetical protein
MLFQHQSIVDEKEQHEPSWVLGSVPGPYITELSRSCFMFLGRKVAFLGLDCRTERTVWRCARCHCLMKFADPFHCKRGILSYQGRPMICYLSVFAGRLFWEKQNT